MALRKTFTFQGKGLVDIDSSIFETGNVSIEFDAYIKVAKIVGDKAKLFCYVHFIDGAKIIQKQYEFAPSMNGDNFIKQAYVYLKTLPEFNGAIDC